MRYGFRVGLGFEDIAILFKHGAQFGKILDDAIVDDGQPRRCMRMRVAHCRRTMGRPAGVAKTDRAAERIFLQQSVEIDQLTFGAAAIKHAAFERCDPGGIIAAIFKPLQRIHKQWRNLFTPDNSYDPTHK